MARAMIRWTDDEWDQIAESVAVSLMNDPTASIVGLTNAFMSQFPSNRRRKISTNKEIEPLISRIKTRYANMRERLRDYDGMAARLASHKSADEVLESLTDTEVINRFGSRVLHLMTASEILSNYTTEQLLEGVPTSRLVGEAARRFSDDILNHPVIRQIQLEKQTAPITVTPVRRRLPKVCIIGVMNRQQNEVTRQLGSIADLRFVDVHGSRSHDVPTGMDIYACMLKFINHPTEQKVKQLAAPGTYLPIQGGMERLIATLQDKITEWLTHVRA